MVLSLFSYAYWPFAFLLWRNVSQDTLPIFKLSCFAFSVALLWSYEFVYMLDSRLLSDIWFRNICSQFVSYLFIFLIVFFKVHKFLILIKSNCASFSLAACLLGVISNKPLKSTVTNTDTWSFFKKLMVLALTHKPLTKFELLFVYSVR